MLCTVATQQADISQSVWAAIEPETARRLLLAAVDVFAEVGYHAASTREIAQRAGLSPAGMYAFYASKAQLLETISTIGHKAALDTFNAALDEEQTVSARVWSSVQALAEWHAKNHQLARVVQRELRALPPPALKRIGVVRRRFAGLLEAELSRGVETEEFAITDIHATANAMLSLCIDITRWYTPRGRYSPHQLGVLYADLSIRMVRRAS